jgi:O-antigen/teichoic acid export membrane protein
MEASQRIIVNTLAQYSKSIINICLSLYSTRLVLSALDISDYGIYSVVAGVVGVLGYLTNSLVVTTQRYLSYYHGIGDIKQVKRLFANSLFIHLVLGLLFCLSLFLIGDYLIDSFLNIPSERLKAAGMVYSVMVLMLFVTVGTSPFKALLIARENIVYISIVEIIDGILKLLLALSLAIIGLDKLVFYSIGMLTILILNLMAYVVYVIIKYEESHIGTSLTIIDKHSTAQLLGFAGWTTYGMVAGMCQTQGLAIVLNKFFGTAINAAFGIASQVNGAIRFVSTSILNAMNPQIMKAEGNHNREKMLELASKESKFSTALMMVVSIPVMIEMPAILDLWLKEVPTYTCTFCRALMLAFLLDQTTLGLHAANQAIGKIKTYSLIMFTPKILIVPVAWFMFKAHYSISTIMTVYVGIELSVAIGRIPYLKMTAGLPIKTYLTQIILPLIPLGISLLASGLAFNYLADFPYNYIVNIILSATIGCLTLMMFVLDKKEKKYIASFFKKKEI